MAVVFSVCLSESYSCEPLAYLAVLTVHTLAAHLLGDDGQAVAGLAVGRGLRDVVERLVLGSGIGEDGL